MSRLLIVHHTTSPSLHSMFDAAHDGASDPSITGIDVVARPALTTTAVDVLDADAYLLGTPANLGYMSGALKHFFDQIYYPCLDATIGRPYGLYVHGNNDTAGAVKAVEVITTGLKWRVAQQHVAVVGDPRREDIDRGRRERGPGDDLDAGDASVGRARENRLEQGVHRGRGRVVDDQELRHAPGGYDTFEKR